MRVWIPYQAISRLFFGNYRQKFCHKFYIGKGILHWTNTGKCGIINLYCLEQVLIGMRKAFGYDEKYC